MGKSKAVIVTVTDAGLENIHSVAKQLANHGMTVDQVLPITGIISGRCPSDKTEHLKSLPGVHSVEEETHVQLPPPDSKVQ
jgi:hypothetical protein